MQMVLTSKEVGVLCLHMQIMKTPVKKGFKKAYRGDWKEKLNCYGSIIDQLQEIIEQEDTDKEFFLLELTELQFEMLHSYINWYVPQLNEQKNELRKLDKQTIETLAALEGIQHKTNIRKIS